MGDWSRALEALNEFYSNSYDLPSDHSLISPVARVILQKRRLIKVQEIHNLLLAVSHEPSETLLQSENERDFLVNFKPTFAKLPWNELSVCEAQSFAGLLVDTLQRCQADSQLINFYIKQAVAEIQGPDFKDRIVALRTSLIIVRMIFISFPKATCPWANDLVKAILNNLKAPQKGATDFDSVLEVLRCLQVLLRLPGKFIETREREKVLYAVTRYLKANNPFIAIEAAKVYEAYYGVNQVIVKAEIKRILDLLNGGLSLRLYECKCSPKLLEHCFELKSADKPELDWSTLKLNIERVRKYPYIDAGMFADAFSNVLCRWKRDSDADDGIFKILMLLLPANSKSPVSSKCFANIIENYMERCDNHREAIGMIRFIFENLAVVPCQYADELIGLLTRLYDKFPGSLKESDFSSFAPLTVVSLQLKSADLIVRVLRDQPMSLASQLTLIFAQLKGDFLRLKFGEPNVNKEAVIGLLRFFHCVLRDSMEHYANYCDRDLIEKIKHWVINQFTDESDWLVKELDIINGLLNLTTSFASESSVVAILSNLDAHKHPESLLKFLLICVAKDSEFFKIFFGWIEKYIHDLNVLAKLPESVLLADIFPIMRLLIDNKRENTLAVMVFITKLICFTAHEDQVLKYTQITEVYSKMFWRSSKDTRDYCMKMFSSCVSNNTAFIPSQILQCVRSVLESSEIPRIDNSGLIEDVQEIVRKFVVDESFEVRLECGIVMGLLVKLFYGNDEEGIKDVFTQFMKHAMKSPVPSKSRVSYILGLATLKAHLDCENMKFIDFTANMLIGLLASWNRESDFESKSQGQEIVASTIIALTFYLDKCGCLVKSEFYRDTCELLLEQVFLRQRCELTMKAVLGLAKCLGLYANLMPCQSDFIRRTVRLLAECGYLNSYRTFNMDLLVDISECNPCIAKPSELIYKMIRRNAMAHRRDVFGKICQYFNLQVSFDSKIALELIDSGTFLFLLERTSLTEGFEFGAMSFLVQRVMSITLMDRFNFWLECVFENLSLTERTNTANLNVNISPKISLSDSAFSLTDLTDSISQDRPFLIQNTVYLVVSSLAGCISSQSLMSLDQNTLKRFLNCLIKICFNISAEKSQERKVYLSGISLFRGIVKTFSRVLEAGNNSILEPFDSQIVSIISSILRASEEGDPLYAACAFGALFSLCSSRPDLQRGLKQETGRVYSLLKKAVAILKEHEIYWRDQVVENLILLSIIVGLCSLIKSGFDIGVLDPEIRKTLGLKIEECFEAYRDGELERNVRASLSGPDRLLLVEMWTILNEKTESIDSVLSVLHGLNSESIESVCLLSTEIFKRMDNPNLEGNGILNRLLNQILQFGLDKRDPMVVDCLMELKSQGKFDCLRKLSKEFLTVKFSDFDTEFGLKVLKAEESLVGDDIADQVILFDILRKLISCCINDLEVNYSKDILKTVKTIFSNPKISRRDCNDLVVEWICLLEEIDSVFLNQLVFFSVSSNPSMWEEEVTLRKLRKHFMKLLASVNTLEMALDSWILLLKSQSKQRITSTSFDTLVDSFTDQIEVSFQKHRGSSIDPIWERVFAISQLICNSSDRDMTRVMELSIRSLEAFNDFK